MEFALSDIAFKDVGLHVVSSLAAFIVVDFYKSIRSRDRAQRRQGDAIRRVAAAGDGAATGRQSGASPQVRRSWLSLLFGWLFLFLFKLVVKATLALLIAGLAIGWLQSKVDVAAAYRLSPDTADSLLAAAFFLLMVLVWWILPIRLFKR